MMIRRRIKVNGRYLHAYKIPLGEKSLILIRGKRGYIMCGYLDIAVSEKFGDAAIRVTGVSSVKDVLKSKVGDCTSGAKKLGIFAGQDIREAIKMIL